MPHQKAYTYTYTKASAQGKEKPTCELGVKRMDREHVAHLKDAS